MELQWFDVGVVVGGKRILSPSSGRLRSGRMMALMGPSGCGKTTFLSCLRQDLSHEGEVFINGCRLTSKVRHAIGFVEQDDIVIPDLTARQSLLFLAELRFGVGSKEARQRTELLLTSLGLDGVADSKIGVAGDEEHISGGQRKRLCIARELMGEPSLLLCDEPTSGLDSTMADQVVASMRALTNKRSVSVIAAIHQPSTNIFSQFDDLLLLSKGEVLYLGPAAEAERLFNSWDLKRNALQSTAEFLMDTLALPPRKAGSPEMALELDLERALETGGAFIGGLSAEVRASLVQHARAQAKTLPSRAAVQEECRRERLLSEPCYAASGLRQVWLLTRRTYAMVFGSLFTLQALVQNLGLMTVSALLWVQLGFHEQDMFPRYGICMWTCGTWMFFPMFAAAPVFKSVKAMLEKELRMGCYSLGSFYLSHTILPLPLEFVFPTMWCTGLFWITNVSPSFVIYVEYLLLVYLNFIVFQGFGLMVSASGMPPSVAQTCLLICITFFFAWSGFFMDMDSVPVWLRWASDANPFYYSVSLLMYIILPDSVEFTCGAVGTAGDATMEGRGCLPQADGSLVVNGVQARERFGTSDNPALCVGVLLACVAVSRSACFVLLRRLFSTAIDGARTSSSAVCSSSANGDADVDGGCDRGEPELDRDSPAGVAHCDDDEAQSTGGMAGRALATTGA